LKWKRLLKYIGFGGLGHQVRDSLHPRDLSTLLTMQMRTRDKAGRVANVSGGVNNSISLANLSLWCEHRFGPHHQVTADPVIPQYDLPWLVLDSALAHNLRNWRPSVNLDIILEKIAEHAEKNPHWLELSNDT
jgi:CDP-paratose 2-epimerase